MPNLVMMCGIPASGKSTYIQQGLDYTDFFNTGYTFLSTDNYIEEKAKKEGTTYNEIFDCTIKEATEEMNKLLEFAIQNNMSIVWDQTNLTPKVRQKKLKKIPEHYTKVAVYNNISLEEAMKRNRNRIGKVIPQRVLIQMHSVFVPPTEEEGFDKVIQIGEQHEMQS
jgi:predicted kinase